jgi:uncharacterized protein YdhG (YjbR/CyaY superfamily)
MQTREELIDELFSMTCENGVSIHPLDHYDVADFILKKIREAQREAVEDVTFGLGTGFDLSDEIALCHERAQKYLED